MKPVPGWFKAPCWFMAAFYAFSVVVQYNDPDPRCAYRRRRS